MRLVSAALFALLLPTVAAAQNSGIFVQSSPLLDALLDSSYGVVGGVSASLTLVPVGASFIPEPPTDEQTKSTRQRFAPGGAVAIGVFLSPSVSLRVETSFQGDHVSTDETSSASQRSRSLYQQTVGIADISVAAAWHQGAGRRVGLSYVGGVVFRRQANETLSSLTYPSLVLGPGGRLVPSLATETEEETFQSTFYDRGIMAGIDLTVTITSRFALVPQVRMVAATGSWNVRPALALRWRP